MKRLFRILGRVLIIGIVFVAGALLYSTIRGSTAWFFRVNGHVTIDGRATGGYLHANTERTILLITRTDGARPETYLVPLRDKKPILDCGEWHPIRFLPNALANSSAPCSGFTKSAAITDAPVDSTLVFKRTSVEFSTSSGKKVKAEW